MKIKTTMKEVKSNSNILNTFNTEKKFKRDKISR